MIQWFRSIVRKHDTNKYILLLINSLIGLHLKFHKVAKFVSSIFYEFRYLIAARFSISDAGAYAFKGAKLFEQMKREEARKNSDWEAVIRYGLKGIDSFKYALELNPDLLRLWRSVSKIQRFLGDEEACLESGKIYCLEQKRVSTENQSSKLRLRIINKKPLMQTIGNYGYLDGYLKFKILYENSQENLALLLRPGERNEFANSHILRYFEKYVQIIDDPVICDALAPFEEELMLHLGGPFEYQGGALSTHSIMSMAQQRWIDEGHKPLLSLDEHDLERGRKALTELGVPDDAWYVCLHVREGKGAKGDEPFRQANILDYMDAVKAVVSRGGWVFRMGDTSMIPLPKMKNVIDYARSNFKSEWMDVFLCGSSKFFIGTSSGLCTFAMTFGVPIVQTNYLPTNTLSFTSNDLFLPKLCRKKNSQNFISFQELMSSPVSAGGSQKYYDEFLNVETVDNTPDELRGIVVEMMDILENKKSYNEEEQSIQQKFLDMTAEYETLPGLKGSPINCRIGQDFLTKHQSLLM